MHETDNALKPLKQPSRLWTAMVLGALTAIGPLSMDMYLPALPVIGDELNASTSMTQLSLTACLLGMAVGQLIAGPISDVRGRRFPLMIGVAVYAMISLLCVFAPSIGVFIGLRFVQGLAGAVGIVISRASVRDMYAGVELTKFFALLMLVNGAAPILAPILGAEVLVYTSWRGVFAVLSGIGVLMLLAVMFGLKETLPPERRSRGGFFHSLATYRRLLGDSSFIGYALIQGFIMAGMFAYISGSTFVLQEIFGVSARSYSLIFGINGIGIIVAGQIAGRLAGRVRERTILGSGLVLSFSGGLLLLLAALVGGGLYVVLPALFLVVASVGLIATTTSSLAMQNQGQSAGTASALLGMLSFIVGGAAAPLVGIGGSASILPMAVVIAVLNILALVCFLFLTKRSGA
ncbi:multidrug effflux MFS transporter [Paenibacillus oenotherae]|uniref:Bcr/CflA family efflux transporter n=1 Tax=Paenibacillus oenotherae TaxID=1435645 RepID=A0ABS7D688_9BACL|nr:multidrug effflux MFS transporter [Paenibacillus oenotherae]MBW7475443.1 multidrug effflux MFS transporter [Paenibacillus oenotherae]